MASCQRIGASLRLFSLPIRTAQHRPRPQSLPQAVSIAATPVRYASHAEQGRANGVKQGAGKRLGAKKTGGQPVVPGNIIFRQRGTLWFPGENCSMGRDHTIMADVKGFVRYYRDPARHPDRRYIGVALEKEQNLPTPSHVPRHRRVGLVAVPYAEPKPYAEEIKPGEPVGRTSWGKPLKMRSNYMFSVANWEIGQQMDRQEKYRERKGIKPFVKNDRWLAWRKRAAKIEKINERKALARSSKKGKAQNKSKQKAKR